MARRGPQVCPRWWVVVPIGGSVAGNGPPPHHPSLRDNLNKLHPYTRTLRNILAVAWVLPDAMPRGAQTSSKL